MDISVTEFREVLNDNLGSKVRYRVEGQRDFANDILKDFAIDKENNVNIQLNNNSIDTSEVYQISCTKYSERIDIWLYGKEKTNRFNVYY